MNAAAGECEQRVTVSECYVNLQVTERGLLQIRKGIIW